MAAVAVLLWQAAGAGRDLARVGSEKSMIASILLTARFGLLSNNVLIVDHLNINHEKGRHDLAKAFYFDLLGCVPDPRKGDNLAAGEGTVWANAGIHQFHLSEGKPDAQVRLRATSPFAAQCSCARDDFRMHSACHCVFHCSACQCAGHCCARHGRRFVWCEQIDVFCCWQRSGSGAFFGWWWSLRYRRWRWY